MGDAWRSIDWGNAPAWLGTVGAFIAVGFTWKSLSLERDRDEQRRKKDLASQASGVAAWSMDKLEEREYEFHGSKTASRMFLGRTYWVSGICVRNATQLPVYDARVVLYDPEGEEGEVLSIGPVVPGARNLFDEEIMKIAGEKFIERLPYLGLHPPDVNWGLAVVGLTFQDASGEKWKRDAWGRLHSLGPGGPPVAPPPPRNPWLRLLNIAWRRRTAVSVRHWKRHPELLDRVIDRLNDESPR